MDMVSFYMIMGMLWFGLYFFGKSGWWLWNLMFFNYIVYGFVYN